MEDTGVLWSVQQHKFGNVAYVVPSILVFLADIFHAKYIMHCITKKQKHSYIDVNFFCLSQLSCLCNNLKL